VEGWVVSNGRRGDVSDRPRTARVERSTERARERTSEKTREGEDAFGSRSFRNQNADPYGRGTRRGRRGARPQSASPSTFSETPTEREETLPAADASEDLPPAFSFAFTPPRARGTVRINAWDTMDASFASTRVDGADEDKARFFEKKKKALPRRSSPSRRRGAPRTPRAPRARLRRARLWRRTRASELTPRASARRPTRRRALRRRRRRRRSQRRKSFFAKRQSRRRFPRFRRPSRRRRSRPPRRSARKATRVSAKATSSPPSRSSRRR
jgi:hypothetical protein